MHYAGAHCQFPHCNIFDYLGSKCAHCSAVFCGDHLHTHDCPNDPIKQATGKVAGAVSVQPHSHQQHHNKCALQSCGRKDFAAVQCDYCKKTFCVEHRFQEEHSCPVPPPQPDAPLVAPKPSSCGGRRLGTNQKTFVLGKVPIHVDDQVRLEVAVIPKQLQATVIASRKWSVGKMLDGIVDAVPSARTAPSGGRWRVAVPDGLRRQWRAADVLEDVGALVATPRVLLVPDALVDRTTGVVSLMPALLPEGFKMKTCSEELMGSGGTDKNDTDNNSSNDDATWKERAFARIAGLVR
eukprot:PhM_4_TR2909/c0_g1_i1/m.55221